MICHPAIQWKFPPILYFSRGNQFQTGALGVGNSSLESSSQPLPVALPGVTLSAISAGKQHACALQAGTGRALCWGMNGYGECGRVRPPHDEYNFTAYAQWAPAPVNTTWTFISIAAGNEQTCGVLPTGQLACW